MIAATIATTATVEAATITPPFSLAGLRAKPMRGATERGPDRYDGTGRWMPSWPQTNRTCAICGRFVGASS